MSEEERKDLASKVARAHREGKTKRMLSDLTKEKYLIHVDGENDGQWADIIHGQAVIIPPKIGSTLRLQQNLLRPMVDNFVAYNTSIPLKVVAEAPMGRKVRDRARIDTLLANHVIQHQKLNSLLAEAMYVSAVYGYCPVHSTWRYDTSHEVHMPVGDEQLDIQPGFVDIWVGDPWDTVFNDSATRNSVHWLSYGRTISLAVLKNAFEGLPWVAQLRGNSDLPSASRFQRIVRRWNFLNQFHRASAALSSGTKNEEMVVTVTQELAPGVDPEWPDGRLVIVALSGASSTDRWTAGGASSEAVLLFVGPLPARRFSVTRFYALHRYDDVGGKPYVADIDDLQVQLNNVITLRAERLKRFAMPQPVGQAGTVEPDTLWGDPNVMVEYTGSKAPEFLQMPNMSTNEYDMLVREIESQMFRIGGWQAASRGESNAGDPAAKVVALAKADDTIFGPINKCFQDSLAELLATAHALIREFADLPLLARVSGEDMSYAIDPWINPQELSREDPIYRVVSGFGSTPESLAQTLMNLATTVTPGGAPLLDSEEFWDRYPDPSLRPHRPNLKATKRLRLNTINYFIEKVCNEAERKYMEEVAQNPELGFVLAQNIAQVVSQYYPPVRTDDVAMALESLDELVHDTTISGLCRSVAEIRQSVYFEWLMMQQQAAAAGPAGQPPSGGSPPAPSPAPHSGSGTPPQSSKFGGTRTSETMNPGRLMNEVRDLSSAASAGEVR